MSILWQIASLLLLLHSCAPGLSTHVGIVGGKVSIPHSRPYMVYIQDSVTKISCGGFLVKENFVMTAAHCKHSHLLVYLGVNDTKQLPAGVAVEAFPHPKFSMDSPDYDIMLLKLKTPATLNKTVNIINWKKSRFNEKVLNKKKPKRCMVLGWGWQNYDEESPSRVLKEAIVTLENSANSNCDMDGKICSEGSSGPSLGDSGGPLVCRDSAEGIVSYYTESKQGYLTRYTNISHYSEWIEGILKNNSAQHQYETWKSKLMKLI